MLRGINPTARRRWVTAVHEAGHAVMLTDYGMPFLAVTIRPHAHNGHRHNGAVKVSDTEPDPPPFDWSSPQGIRLGVRCAMATMAGPAAVRVMCDGFRDKHGAAGDTEAVRLIYQRINPGCTHAEAGRFVQDCYWEMQDLFACVRAYHDAALRLAFALDERQTIPGDEAAAIVRRYLVPTNGGGPCLQM